MEKTLITEFKELAEKKGFELKEIIAFVEEYNDGSKSCIRYFLNGNYEARIIGGKMGSLFNIRNYGKRYSLVKVSKKEYKAVLNGFNSFTFEGRTINYKINIQEKIEL